MGGNYTNSAYYRRKVNPGDTTIEGRASNGMTLDNTGNVFIYSSQNQEVLNQLISSSYTGSVDISPNTDNSFIGILSTSTDSLISKSPISLDLGSSNFTTFNLSINPANFIQPTTTPLSLETTPTGEQLKFTHNPLNNMTRVNNYLITSGFGIRDGGLHKGIDLRASVGTNAYAVWDGIVISTNTNSRGFGYALIIKHPIQNKMTLYGHVDSFTVREGDRVTAGQVVSTTGNRGRSTGPHLHFEVREGLVDSYNDYISNTNPIDPAPFIIDYDGPSFSLPGDEGSPPQHEYEDLILLPIPLRNQDDEGYIDYTLPENENLEEFPLPDEEYEQFVYQTNLAEQQSSVNQIPSSTTTTTTSNGNYYSGTYLGYPIIRNYEDFQIIDPEFYNKVKQVANNIGADYRDLFKVMKHETGGTFSPAITNGVGYYGLIQLNSGAIQRYGYTISQYTSMTRTRQMDEVERFYTGWKNTLRLNGFSAADLYIACFWPRGVGKPDSYILQDPPSLSAEKIARDNPAFNRRLGRPVGEALTIGKLKQYYRLVGML